MIRYRHDNMKRKLMMIRKLQCKQSTKQATWQGVSMRTAIKTLYIKNIRGRKRIYIKKICKGQERKKGYRKVNKMTLKRNAM